MFRTPTLIRHRLNRPTNEIETQGTIKLKYGDRTEKNGNCNINGSLTTRKKGWCSARHAGTVMSLANAAAEDKILCITKGSNTFKLKTLKTHGASENHQLAVIWRALIQWSPRLRAAAALTDGSQPVYTYMYETRCGQSPLRQPTSGYICMRYAAAANHRYGSGRSQPVYTYVRTRRGQSPLRQPFSVYICMRDAAADH